VLHHGRKAPIWPGHTGQSAQAAVEVERIGLSSGLVVVGKAFAPRLMLPLSLTFDHRVIDGATAARFMVYLAKMLGDFRRVML